MTPATSTDPGGRRRADAGTQAARSARTRSGGPQGSVALMWFALAAIPTAALLQVNDETVAALRVLAVASLIGGLAVFASHGGRRITAAGVFCLATGLMAGAGAWYWAADAPNSTSLDSILWATLSIYGSTALMYILFWHSSLADPAFDPPPVSDSSDSSDSSDGSDRPDHPTSIPPTLARNLPLAGIALFLIGSGGQTLGLGLGTLAKSTAEVGLVIFGSCVLLGARTSVLRSPGRIALVGAAMLTFYLVVFSGGGRLRLAAVVLTIVIVAQFRLRTPIKLLAVAALIPTLLIFSHIGHTRLAAKTGDSSASPAAGGLGSLVNPLRTYGVLVDEGITEGHGSTFAAELVVLIPHRLWEGKPDQFGKVIAWKLRPNAAAHGLSMPCTAQCESYYNFAWPGILLMIPFFGWMIRWLDRHLVLRGQASLDNPLTLFLLMFLATLIGTITDLAWGGTATWAVRNIQRLLVFLPFLVWAYLSVRQTKQPPQPVRTGASDTAGTTRRHPSITHP